MQVTRGVAERDFAFPKVASPTVMMFTQVKNHHALAGCGDRRGGRHRAGPSLEAARHQVGRAPRPGARQAGGGRGRRPRGLDGRGRICHRGQLVHGLHRHCGRAHRDAPLSNAVLPGITRLSVLRLVQETGLSWKSAPSPPEEARRRGAFLTSASSCVLPVVAIDGKRVGNGVPGTAHAQAAGPLPGDGRVAGAA